MTREAGLDSDRRTRFTWIAFALGVVVGLSAFGVAHVAHHRDDMRVVRGDVGMVDVDGSAVDIDGESYVIGNSHPWQGIDGRWRDSGQPECLQPLSTGATVELGILPVPQDHTGNGYPNNVAWVRCLSN